MDPIVFSGKVWKYQGDAAWYFVSLPKDVSADIRDVTKGMTHGWGSIRIRVVADDITWQTSIFPDSASSTYLLPLKAEIRKRLSINEGDDISLSIQIML